MDELRWFQQELGLAREWDVSIDEVLAPPLKDRRSSQGIEQLEEMANAHRTSAHKNVRKALRSPRLKRLLHRMELWIDLLAGEGIPGKSTVPQIPSGWKKKQKLLAQPVMEMASQALQAQHSKAHKRNILKLDDMELHQLRIQLKELRYTTELFYGLWHKNKNKKTMAHYLIHLKHLQSVLGSAHDATVAVNLIQSIRSEAGAAIEKGADEIVGRIIARHENDRNRLKELWKHFTKIETFWNEE